MTSVSITEGGKAEYVRRRRPDGTIQNVCACYFNTEFGKHCIGHVLGEDLQDVLNNDGRYPDIEEIKRRNDGQFSFGCEQCYAKAWNQGPLTQHEVTEQTKADMQVVVNTKPDPMERIIRLGKSTEVGHPYYRQTLIDFLNLCAVNEARVILPTRMLEFDKEVADLLRETRSALNYSISADFIERGPVSQGYNQYWRMMQALDYHDAGVRTSLTFTGDVTSSFDHNAEQGFPIYAVLAAHRQAGIPLRLLPMRLPSKEVALKVTGRSWDELLQNPMFFSLGEEEAIREQAYEKGRRNNRIEARVCHQDFQALYDRIDGDNIGACEKVNGYEHCDQCGLVNSAGKVPSIRFPITQLARPPRRNNNGKKKFKTESHESLPLFQQELQSNV